jgi:hypothetical protein
LGLEAGAKAGKFDTSEQTCPIAQLMRKFEGVRCLWASIYRQMDSQSHCAQVDVSFGTLAQQKSLGGLLRYYFIIKTEIQILARRVGIQIPVACHGASNNSGNNASAHALKART